MDVIYQIVLFALAASAKPFQEVGDGNITAVYGGGETEHECPTRGRGTVDPLSTLCLRLACNITELQRSTTKVPDHFGCFLRNASVERDFSDSQSSWLAHEIFTHSFKNRQHELGTYIEFGSKDGRYQSNSFVFEAAFGWSGLQIDLVRNYIAPLRRFRTCRFRGQKGACVWAALSSKDGEKLVSDNKGAKLLPASHVGAPSLLSQEGSFEVSTVRLDSIMSRFHMRHVDFLSADCEGCETIALSGLNLDKVSVGVLLIEHPTCKVAEMFMSRGYTAIFLWASYDTIFLSPRVVRRIPSPGPDLTTQLTASKQIGDQKALLFKKKCPGLASQTWEMGKPWPPPTASDSHFLLPKTMT